MSDRDEIKAALEALSERALQRLMSIEWVAMLAAEATRVAEAESWLQHEMGAANEPDREVV